MRSLVRTSLAVLAAVAALGSSVAARAQSPDDELVVVARRVGPDASWPHCGVLAVRGEVVFETVRVERGPTDAFPARFVAVVQCPASTALHGTQRLRLGTRPRHATGPIFPPRAPDELTRYHLRGHTLAEAPTDLGRFLGQRRHELAALYPPTRAAGGWTHYGEVLAVRLEARRIVEIRARLPREMTCAEVARWAGYPDAGPPLRRAAGCEWPGQSERHRLTPGVVGQVVEGQLVLRRR